MKPDFPSSSAPGPATSPPGGISSAPRQLVLLGAGQAHLELLARLSKQPLPPGVRVVWIAPQSQVFFAPRVPDWVSGRYRLDACMLSGDALAQRAGTRAIYSSPVALDVRHQRLRTADGVEYPYDWLSVNLGADTPPDAAWAQIPGAAQFGTPVYPLESFLPAWTALCARAQHQSLRIAVIGNTTAARELALAVRVRLPKCPVTLVLQASAGNATPPLPDDTHWQTALKSKGITVLHDTVVALTEHDLALGCGAHLACDAALVALQSAMPPWLANSGLHVDAPQVRTDDYLRSQSHPRVFVIKDGGAPEAYNVIAAATDSRLRIQPPALHALRLAYGGAQRAIAGWRGLSRAGYLWHWLREWRLHRAMARYR
ncbi:MAG: hypothetical protein QE265_07540 [Rhodoferax sp.]|nr:hypothetical protein [Rhodoferax sp.]